MLVLSRKPGQSILIGETEIKVLSIHGRKLRLGIDAPPETRVLRTELMATTAAGKSPERVTCGDG